MFGPKEIFCKRSGKNVALSPKLCWVNNLLTFVGNVASLFLLYLQFCGADPYRCSQLHFGYFQYLMLGSENENYVIASPPGLVIFFHFLSVFFFAFVIHFNSCKSISSFMTPLECLEKEIISFVHQLEDPRDPDCVPREEEEER